MKQNPKIVRLIVDPRDATRDKWLRKEEAERLHKEGKIAWDATNGEYCK